MLESWPCLHLEDTWVPTVPGTVSSGFSGMGGPRFWKLLHTRLMEQQRMLAPSGGRRSLPSTRVRCTPATSLCSRDTVLVSSVSLLPRSWGGVGRGSSDGEVTQKMSLPWTTSTLSTTPGDIYAGGPRQENWRK